MMNIFESSWGIIHLVRRKNLPKNKNFLPLDQGWEMLAFRKIWVHIKWMISSRSDSFDRCLTGPYIFLCYYVMIIKLTSLIASPSLEKNRGDFALILHFRLHGKYIRYCHNICLSCCEQQKCLVKLCFKIDESCRNSWKSKNLEDIFSLVTSTKRSMRLLVRSMNLLCRNISVNN